MNAPSVPFGRTIRTIGTLKRFASCGLMRSEATDAGTDSPEPGLGWHSAIGLLLPLALLSLWYLAAAHQWMPAQILPSPQQVYRTFLDLLQSGDLIGNLLISLRRLATGLCIGALAGVLLGTAMGIERRVEMLLRPLFSAIVQIPTLAWIPLLMQCFGIGDALKLVVIVKAVIVPVTLQTLAGVRDVAPDLKEVARSVGLSRRQTLASLILPSALPSLMTGLRLALSDAWLSLIVVELLASSEGIGYLMVNGRQLFQLDVVMVCVITIGLTGLALDKFLQAATRLLVRWPPPALSVLAQKQTAPYWMRYAPLCVVIGLWQFASWQGWLNRQILVPPYEVGQSLLGSVHDGSLFTALYASVTRAVAGFVIGAGVGTLVGLALGLWRTLDRLCNPLLNALRHIALFAWLPLITAWAGLGEASKIVFVALATFYPMVVAAHAGVRSVPPKLLELADTVGLSGLARLRLLILPAATPSLFSGLHLSLLYAWLATIGAEYFMSSGPGIGSTMINAGQMFEMAKVIAMMLIAGLMSMLFNRVGMAFEQRASRWRIQHKEG